MILFGASGHAKVVADILINNGVQVEKIIDDAPAVEEIFGIPVEKNNMSADSISDVIISIGNNNIRKLIVEKYNFQYLTAIHPKAVISHFSHIQEGTVVMANAVINPNVKIGKHCIINTSSVVEHDCEIGDYAHISPNASLAGNVKVGTGSHIGIGATVIQGISIGRWATVGAGAVIIKDVPDGATIVGNPGRIIKIKN